MTNRRRILSTDSNVAVAYLCTAMGCGEIATIMVQHRECSKRPLCAEHWAAAREAVILPLSPVRILPRPDCFVAGCSDGAVAIMEHIDSTLLPCCESHLNDLSWVVPDEAALRSRS